MDAFAFLQSVAGVAQSGPAPRVRLGAIDPDYSSATFPGTLPKVTFDGEATLSGKRYPVAGTYLPTAGDRVVLVPSGSTYVIVAALDSDASARVGGGLDVAGSVDVGVDVDVTGDVAVGGVLSAPIVDDLVAPGWPTYGATDLLAATVSSPTKGSSTYTARYRRVSATADIVEIAFKIAIDTTGWSAGSGTYAIKLPVSMSSGHLSAGGAGPLYVVDSGTAYRCGVLIPMNTAYLQMVIYNVTGTPLDHSGPGTAWATGDIIQGSYTYEPA